jgi:hypothetical protein
MEINLGGAHKSVLCTILFFVLFFVFFGTSLYSSYPGILLPPSLSSSSSDEGKSV